MIGQRVLAQLEDGTLINCGVVTGISDDGLTFTTQRYPDLESFLSKGSELMQLCMDMGMGF